jgi:FkbM family methyltransferase
MGVVEHTEHSRALELLQQGDAAQAQELLFAVVRDAVDPELLNDLAVVTAQAGDIATGADLLQALVALHPEHRAGAENLAALGVHPPRPEHAATPPVAAATDDRRARFLQTIADGLGTHLADNIDYLFEPWGRELPDPATTGDRIAEQLAVLDRCDTIWRSLGDEASRSLLLRFLAYKALGPAHIRLQLDASAYRRAVIGLSATALVHPVAVSVPGLPLEWQMHQYDMSTVGLPISVIGPPLSLTSTMVLSQYAYRDPAIPARPRSGDVALDAGGCWGETALWLAHMVGPEGQVHTFEPTPGNRQLLLRNLSLNPVLAPRITVWDDPLGPTPGEAVWIPDVIAAGATTFSAAGDRNGFPTLELRTQTIDAVVARAGIPHLDFLKVDVEGADLGVLHGAANTIRRDRPRLAVACYHKPDDLVTIPEFISSLGIKYHWYLQCSTMTDVDTVAFGVPMPE